jgi:hypothetical protein
MPRTALAIQSVPQNSAGTFAGVTPDAVNGNMFDNDANTSLHINNGDAAAKTVTVRSVPCSHGRSVDVVLAIPAGQQAVCGPFDQSLFSQPSGADQGKVYVDWSASTNVKVAARRRG